MNAQVLGCLQTDPSLIITAAFLMAEKHYNKKPLESGFAG
jgi:hypothetical protein